MKFIFLVGGAGEESEGIYYRETLKKQTKKPKSFLCFSNLNQFWHKKNILISRQSRCRFGLGC